jgi:SAM-dependent methyltransferase
VLRKRLDAHAEMTDRPRLTAEQFPLASRYHPEWMAESASGGANSLWLTEWLSPALELKPGMRVLDLGCGRAASSIFLHREFGVQVWAVDLWFSAAENLLRIRDAGAESAVFPLHADARALPFSPAFFDAIVGIDSFLYFGTDDLYLNYIVRFLKPGGVLGIASAGLTRDFDGPAPEHLSAWWTPDLWPLHSTQWWRRHWERTCFLDIEVADTMEEGWRIWVGWHQTLFPENKVEIDALKADAGRHLGYVRVVGRLRPGVTLPEPISAASIPAQYTKKPLLRLKGE